LHFRGLGPDAVRCLQTQPTFLSYGHVMIANLPKAGLKRLQLPPQTIRGDHRNARVQNAR
jgi:hypothetical protein